MIKQKTDLSNKRLTYQTRDRSVKQETGLSNQLLVYQTRDWSIKSKLVYVACSMEGACCLR